MNNKYLSNDEIIKLIDQNKWDAIYDALLDNRIKHPNKLLINGNNILHMSAIRGETDFVEKIFEICYAKGSNTAEDSSEPLKESAKIACGINPDLMNEDGLPAIHLYYKYGGTSKKLLKLSSVCYLDREYTSLLTYLIDSITLLEVYIDSTVKKSCLSNIEYVGDDMKQKQNIYYLLIKQIKKLNDPGKSSIKQRYLKIVSHLMRNLTNKKAVHYAIAMDSHEVFDHLVKEDLFDPMIRNLNRETPLIMAIYSQNPEFVRKILDVYVKMVDDPINADLPNIKEYISLYRSFSDGRPINICLKDGQYDILEIFIDFLTTYRKKHDDTAYHTETDEYNSTYLHNFLMNEKATQNIDKQKRDTVSYLIRYTDLNQENYYGYTSAQLIFLMDFWKTEPFDSDLVGRKIDLLKVDPNGRNIYSYISKNDNANFMELTSKLILLTNTQGSSNNDAEIYDIERIIDVVSRDHLKEKKNYGLFNPTQMNYIMFMLYLQKNHSNLFVPQRDYDADLKKDQQYVMEMTTYPLSSIQETFNEIQLFDHVRFFSHSPHLITWHDSNIYLINSDLANILKKQNEADPDTTRRFVMIKLLIVLTENANHANCLIYDRKKKEAWRFESYGLTDMVKDGNIMDTTLQGLLESVYGKIKYYGPSSYLSNIKFQLADNEDFTIAKSLGDPGGYCLAWCIWFIDVICSNLHGESDEPTVKYLMHNYITRARLQDIMYEPIDIKSKTSAKNVTKSPNIYLEYIRQYGHYLDQQKNAIMKEIGVSESTYYKFSVKSRDMDKIDSYLQVKDVKYD
jgi:ankyrin repeat protein